MEEYEMNVMIGCGAETARCAIRNDLADAALRTDGEANGK